MGRVLGKEIMGYYKGRIIGYNYGLIDKGQTLRYIIGEYYECIKKIYRRN